MDQFTSLDGLTDGVAMTRPELDSIHGVYLLWAKDTTLTPLSRGLPPFRNGGHYFLLDTCLNVQYYSYEQVQNHLDRQEEQGASLRP